MPNNVDYVSGVTKTTFDPATLTANFQPLNGSGFSDCVRIWKLWNGSASLPIEISFDGVTAHDYIPPQGTLIVDFQTNHDNNSSNSSGTKVFRKGQVIWGRTPPGLSANFLQIIGYN